MRLKVMTPPKLHRQFRYLWTLIALLIALVGYCAFRIFTDFGFSEAANRTDVGAMRVWLRLGADIDFRDVDRTPLQWAIENSNQKTTLALLELGANPNVRWQDGIASTALMTASSENWPDVVKTLIEKGAKVSDKNNSGKTALDLAQPNSEVAVLLKRARQIP